MPVKATQGQPRRLAIFLACCAIGTAGASDGSVDAPPNKLPALEQSEQCNDAMVNAAMPTWPKDALRSGTSGWAIVRYDLDGSGRVQNAEVVASAPQQVFDKAALQRTPNSA